MMLRQVNQQYFFYLVSLACLVPLAYVGNPAIALLVAISLSLLSRQNLVPSAARVGKMALQTAIVLLGFKLNVGDLWELSTEYSPAVTLYVLSALACGLLLGKLLRVETALNKLISSGTAICGGTTIASLAPIVGARPDQTGVAMALVFILNGIALVVFPLIGEYIGLTQTQFGVWCALAIHDTSSVVATAAIYGEEALATATTLKLGRTLWLIPLLLMFSVLEDRGDAKLQIPGFILLFIAASVVGSLVPIPHMVVDGISLLSKTLLVVALFCIGSEIKRETLQNLKGITVIHGVLIWCIFAPLTLMAIVYLV